MINNDLFNGLFKRYVSFGSLRHQIIKDSSDILRMSKQSIFALHRGELDKAGEMFDTIEKSIADFMKNRKEGVWEGSFRAALEEYLEAKLFYLYLKKEKLDFVPEVPAEFYEEYLGGICDFTGELVRRSVLMVSKGKCDEINDIHDLVENIIENLAKFDLVGKLRVKYDDVKRNLKRIEEILYDVKIRGLI